MAIGFARLSCWSGRSCALAMSFSALAIGLAAVILASTLRLEACHLCIFQRLVYFMVGAALMAAFFFWNISLIRTILLTASTGFSGWGLSVAAQQSWLQWFPESGLTCTIVEPGVTERLIDWLGHISPLFFMATGNCGSKDLVFLGWSLANWSFVMMLVFLFASFCLLLQKIK